MEVAAIGTFMQLPGAAVTRELPGCRTMAHKKGLKEMDF